MEETGWYRPAIDLIREIMVTLGNQLHSVQHDYSPNSRQMNISQTSSNS